MIAAASLAVGSAEGPRLVAAGVAFYGVFGVFLVAFAVLSFVSVRWAIRRDRVGRAEWAARRQAQGRPGAAAGGGPRRGAGRRGPARPQAASRVGPPQSNGHGPRRPGQKGQERNQPG